MESIPDMFNVASKGENYGIQGYYVQNKYFDARRSRQQKALQISKDKSISMTSRQGKKNTYIDQILKKQAKLPGPTTYNPHQIAKKDKITIKLENQTRETIFDEMQKIQKKFNYPAAGIYDKIQVEKNKSKLKSNLSKAEVVTYLQTQMRNSIELPGVGQYNSKYQVFDQRGNKWKETKVTKIKSKSQRGIKHPEVGTYNPLPIQFNLFENISSNGKKSSKSHFNREQRFKSSKDKPIPFYNVGSEWGMKNKLYSKDILSRIGSSLTHHSVYY